MKGEGRGNMEEGGEARECPERFTGFLRAEK